MTVSYVVLVLFFLVLIGYLARRLRVVDEGFVKNLSNFLFNIAYPAMIINSMLFSFSKESFIQASRLVVISVLVLFISWIVSEIVKKLLKIDRKSAGVATFTIMYSNFTFMAIPVVEQLYGKEMLFYLAVYTAIMRIAYNTLGVNAIARSAGTHYKPKLSSVVNPPLVAIVIGLVIYMFSLKLPYPAARTIGMLADTVSPLGMVVMGLVLAEYPIKSIFSNFKVYFIAFVRLVAIPLIILVLANVMHFTDIERNLSVIIAAMPAATTCVMIATKYGADNRLAAETAFISTIFSIITIPVIAFML